jgi:hypothetical protein
MAAFLIDRPFGSRTRIAEALKLPKNAPPA